MTVAWVLGSSGLLGSALCRALRGDGTTLFQLDQRLSWLQPNEICAQISAAVAAFARQAQGAPRWEIHWAAGVGAMGSTAAALAPETHALVCLLDRLQLEPSLMDRPGALSLASSAGAIYAGCSDEVITERSVVAATTAYATEKLKQEALVEAFVAAQPSCWALIARISSLYGAGPAHSQRQGLLVHMARNIIRNRPIQIYVPFDTMRDYIDADDAALAVTGMVRSAARIGSKRPPADALHQPRVLMQIIASEQPTTIAEILAIFKRLARRTPLVVRSANRLSSLYVKRVQFRSLNQTGYVRPPVKRLAVGISQLMHAEQLLFARPTSSRL